MPKRKIEGEALYPQIRTFELDEDFDIDPTVINVWCQNRNYDPETETYKPQYSYSIKNPKWFYEGTILGAPNELPDLDKASQSLFALLSTSQESFAAHMRGAFTGGNHDVFPVHVNEWALKQAELLPMFSVFCQQRVKS